MRTPPDNNPTNLPEFDLESNIILSCLGINDLEAFEVSVEVAKDLDSNLIPLEEVDLLDEEDE